MNIGKIGRLLLEVGPLLYQVKLLRLAKHFLCLGLISEIVIPSD